MDFSCKRVVVTGAAGFIGSNLTDKLLELNAEVIGIDNLFNGKIENLEDALKNENFKFYKGDIRDLNFLLDVCKDIDIIFHQAAFTNVQESIRMPESCNDINVKGILNVLNTMRKNNIGKIIHASSAAIYGDTPTLPKKENMHRLPISPYGVSKLACEAYLRAYYEVYGINSISLRYFNVYGPRQMDSPYSGVIAIWLGRIIRNEDLIVFGDGTNSRDFTYIKDIIQANLLAPENDSGCEILNIACGSPISLTNLANLMLKITKKENLKIHYTDPKPGDIIHSHGDISKANQLIGFEPKYNQERGLRDYISWYCKKYKIDMKID
ncbi:MAG: SDR family NAD(P)-dependent oxidoreductase [Candidatus Thorarchaeota archaeon]